MRLPMLLILKNEETHGTMQSGANGAGSLVVVKIESMMKLSSSISTMINVVAHTLGGIA